MSSQNSLPLRGYRQPKEDSNQQVQQSRKPNNQNEQKISNSQYGQRWNQNQNDQISNSVQQRPNNQNQQDYNNVQQRPNHQNQQDYNNGQQRTNHQNQQDYNNGQQRTNHQNQKDHNNGDESIKIFQVCTDSDRLLDDLKVQCQAILKQNYFDDSHTKFKSLLINKQKLEGLQSQRLNQSDTNLVDRVLKNIQLYLDSNQYYISNQNDPMQSLKYFCNKAEQLVNQIENSGRAETFQLDELIKSERIFKQRVSSINDSSVKDQMLTVLELIGYILDKYGNQDVQQKEQIGQYKKNPQNTQIYKVKEQKQDSQSNYQTNKETNFQNSNSQSERANQQVPYQQNKIHNQMNGEQSIRKDVQSQSFNQVKNIEKQGLMQDKNGMIDSLNQSDYDQKTNKNQQELTNCVICNTGKREYANVPCGHLIYCQKCQNRDILQCWICRKPVEFIMKILYQ